MTKRTYVDGVLLGTVNTNGNPITNAPGSALLFGARDNNGTLQNWSRVRLDDVKIFRGKVLSDADVAILATGADISPTPVLGTYTVTYRVTDNAGNTSTLARTVNVIPAAPLAISSVTLNDDNTMEITFPTREDRTYQIEVSTDLETWEVADNAVAGTGLDLVYNYFGGGELPMPDPTQEVRIFLRVVENP